jgi:hypothetical protein
MEGETDDLTYSSVMIVELLTKKRDMWNEDEKDVEDVSGCKKPGVELV